MNIRFDSDMRRSDGTCSARSEKRREIRGPAVRRQAYGDVRLMRLNFRLAAIIVTLLLTTPVDRTPSSPCGAAFSRHSALGRQPRLLQPLKRSLVRPMGMSTVNKGPQAPQLLNGKARAPTGACSVTTSRL